MNNEIVILLDGDADLRRMVASWPNVLPSEEKDLTITRWATLSGVVKELVEAKWDIVFGNKICKDDGSIDPVAQQYLAAYALRDLGKGKK